MPRRVSFPVSAGPNITIDHGVGGTVLRDWSDPPPVLVRCTSSTPAGDSGIAAECYPAVIVSADATQPASGQSDLGAVWLTLLRGDVAVTPVQGVDYPCLLSGTFDPHPGSGTTDERPRVFGAAHPALSYGNAPDFGPVLLDTGSYKTIRTATLPDAGMYLILAGVVVASTLRSLSTTQATFQGSALAQVIDSSGLQVIRQHQIFGINTAIPTPFYDGPYSYNDVRGQSQAAIYACAGPTSLFLQGIRDNASCWMHCYAGYPGTYIIWAKLTGLNLSDPGGITVDLG